MANEMFLEGLTAEMSDEFSTLVTYMIDDIKDFGFKNTARSLNIIMPGSKINNRLFGNIFDIKSANIYNPAEKNIEYNFNPSVSAKVLIFQNRIQVFKGVLRLNEVVINKGIIEYETSVVGELGGLVFSMANFKLEDLDFSEYNQDYTLANIVASWDNTPGSGLYYSLIDYGTYSTNKHDWQYNTFRPALYAKEYIDKIFLATNRTYDCDLFNTDRFKSLIIPQNRKLLTISASNLLTANVTSNKVAPYTPSYPPGEWNLPFDSNTGPGFSANIGKTEFTYLGSTSTILSISITTVGTSTSYFFLGTTDLQIRINGTVVGSTAWFDVNNSAIATVPVSPGDIVSIWFVDYQTITITSAILSIDASSSIPVPIQLGDPIEINTAIPPNVLQKDFIVAFLKLFHLYVYDDKFVSNKLVIKPYVDFYNTDPASIDNWSGKINRDKEIRIKPMADVASRYYEFKFKQDNDFYNEEYRKRYNIGYGDYIYDSEFEFSKESNSLEIIFSGTPLVGYLGEDKVYSTIFKKNVSTEENIDSNIRIMQSKKIAGVVSWDILDGATVLGSYTDYPYAGHFNDPDTADDDINFGVLKQLYFTLTTGHLEVNQFNVYYSPYLAEITNKDSRLLTASFYLTPADIYNLDFANLKYIDGVRYKLNKIDNYNASNADECICTLLKVINLKY